MKDYKEPFLTIAQAAEFLGVKRSTLYNWQCTKRYGIPFIKIGRLVRYNKSDLEAFLNRRTRNMEDYKDVPQIEEEIEEEFVQLNDENRKYDIVYPVTIIDKMEYIYGHDDAVYLKITMKTK